MNQETIQVREQWDNTDYRISAEGDLIITNAKGFQNYIDTAIERGAKDITLDLINVKYIDSFGIGVIVKTKADLDKQKGSLNVLVNPTLQNLFAKCHLDDYIDMELTET